MILTHHHRDHAEAAAWTADWGAPLYAHQPKLVDRAAARAARLLRDGEILECGGVRIEALHTPGHSSDHLCLRVDRALHPFAERSVRAHLDKLVAERRVVTTGECRYARTA